MDPTGIIAAIIAATLGGGGLGAWLNHLRGTRKDRVDGFERFYAIWQAEDERRERRHRDELNRQQAEIDELEAKVDHLETIVVALSDELLNAGVDPIAVRRCLHPPPRKETPT